MTRALTRGDTPAAPLAAEPRAPGLHVRPQLKAVVWERVEAELRVVYDRREQLLVSDPGGVVEALLDLLREGGRTLVELAAALSTPENVVPVEDVRDAVALLDEHGLVEDGARLGRLSPGEAER